MRRATFMGRHPKTFTACDIATALSERSAFSWDHPQWPSSEISAICVVAYTQEDGMSVPDGRTSHEIVVKLCRAFSRRYFVNCVAVRPERYGSVANRNRFRRTASQHYGRGAEAGGKAT